ncbi:cytochrome P450, partial [Klebsiella pneumoniae]|uniref:cytochrome P450 n=1 Tax=Klebsiella pneumoniae TaxID=573 RepID=UPI0013D7C179
LDPETQERAAAEAAASGVEDDPAGALAGRLTFVRAVVDETLRLYPPAFVIVRAARGPDAVAGHPVAAGDILLTPPWV